MRVVSGKARGMHLDSVPGDSTRPILDRVKTALFDILRPSIQGISVLDLFGGSGAVGIEALSQGASYCTFLDLEPKAVATIKNNLQSTKLETQAKVHRADAFAYLKKAHESFDLIYIAPPQYKGLWLEALKIIAERPSLITLSGQIIVQIDPSEYEHVELSAFTEAQSRKYGSTLLVFFKKSESA